ncbi:MAG: hypothetical protein KAW09_06410 [Thermoplasmata archaeon]|nr:hypothetical protein [Thermoplasmata archaeon]
MNVEKIVDKAKGDLFEFFSIHPSVVWKEESLQSYLYHRLLVHEPRLKRRLHREFPIANSLKKRDWAGMVDLAITEESSQNFRMTDVKIDCAIEMKFPRHWKTGVSRWNLNKFERDCRGDVRKLSARAENFKDDTKKYFFALRLTTARQVDDVRNIFKKIEWNDIEHSYIECYVDGSECEILE